MSDKITPDSVVSQTDTAGTSYNEYIKTVPAQYPAKEIVIKGIDYSDYAGKKPETAIDGENGKSVGLYEGSSISWKVSVPESGLYWISVEYLPLAFTGDTIVCDILLDSQIPFSQAQNISFERQWANKDEKKFDIYGNQIRPAQVELPAWTKKTVRDASGMIKDPLLFYFTAGEHKLTLAADSEAMSVKTITLLPVEKTPSYAELQKTYQDKGFTAALTQPLRIEAENGAVKSDQTMYPLTDRTSPLVKPYSPGVILYNTIGGTQWKTVGQWIEWTLPVEKDGLYQIALHFKQSIKSDAVSIRELYIDSKLPFAEADSIGFSYDSQWQTAALSDKKGNAYQFYLTAGKHTLRLQVGLGDYRSILDRTDSAILECNRIYRKIVVVTGVSPDLYRDFEFEKVIPGVLKEMAAASQFLKSLEDDIRTLGFSGNQGTDAIKRIRRQLDQMTAKPEIISRMLTAYRDNISSFGTWRNNLMDQPLEVDCLYLQSPGSPLTKADASFFEALVHNVKQFLYSFTSDYSSIGNLGQAANTSIKVWMTTGRDQAQLVKQLINDRFTPGYNIGVNLQLVSADSLLPALLAKTGPDVSLGLAQADPINLALRHSLTDLKKLDGYADIAKQFSAEAMIPFTLNNSVYALPDALSYPMLFYRKDILKELDVDETALNTWDDLLEKVMPVIQKKALSVGLACNLQTYLTMFYQAGGSVYIQNGVASGFASSEGIQTMTKFEMLYSQYKLPLAFDYANRFRSGEMPIVMADYLFYNQLTVFSPEIKGLWGMTTVPGTEQKDGTISHAAAASVTGNVMMANPRNVDSAWSFLRWWTSAEIQAEYGRGLESVVGSAARYNSANKEALMSVKWSKDIQKQLTAQLAEIRCYPEVPGGYLMPRHFDFAVRRILYEGDSVRNSLNEAVEDIDREILRKRAEYKLN